MKKKWDNHIVEYILCNIENNGSFNAHKHIEEPQKTNCWAKKKPD